MRLLHEQRVLLKIKKKSEDFLKDQLSPLRRVFAELLKESGKISESKVKLYDQLWLVT